jgi:nitrogen fixation protein FixH
MLMVMVAGFGIVIAVNFLMAGLATSGFGGAIVTNSYVASQKYNDWLAEARREQALGWGAEISRGADGRLLAATSAVPANAAVRASLRRPLGEPEVTEVELVPIAGQLFQSRGVLLPGRWIVRLQIEHAGQTWRMERELP